VLGLAPEGSRLSRLLCLGAHSDDIEIGCGGTVLKLLERDADLHVDWVVLSAEGERADEARAGAARFLERAKSARVDVRAFEERYFPYRGAAIKRFFDELGGSLAPDLVFTHRLADRHQDHHLVAELTWNTFRDQLILEYEIPKYEGDLGQPNVFVHLERDTAQRKVDAIRETFASQRGRHWFSEETFWSTLRLRGIESRAPSGYAEAFSGPKLVLA